ncbi:MULTISPECIES: hypothetical protein [Paraburkholderia]|uniref:hypothetical protein n=1 Tax=Paraburkholderia TaxID=1822464 RepID=UPI0028AE9E69|nr:hypothetical protein [Paraburkholderia podalyriae]
MLVFELAQQGKEMHSCYRPTRAGALVSRERRRDKRLFRLFLPYVHTYPIPMPETRELVWLHVANRLRIRDADDLFFVATVTMNLIVAALAYVAIMRLWRYYRRRDEHMEWSSLVVRALRAVREMPAMLMHNLSSASRLMHKANTWNTLTLTTIPAI